MESHATLPPWEDAEVVAMVGVSGTGGEESHHRITLKDGRILRLQSTGTDAPGTYNKVLNVLRPEDPGFLRVAVQDFSATRIQIEGDEIIAVTGREPRITPADLAILRGSGADVTAMLRWARHEHAAWRRQGLIASPDENFSIISERLRCSLVAPGMLLAQCQIRIRQLPETLAQAVTGMPLRSVISHPVLDPVDLTILRVTQSGNTTGLVIGDPDDVHDLPER